MLAIGFLGWFIMAAFTAGVAASKGHIALGWLVVGLLFGPIAFLASLGLGPADKEAYMSRKKRACPLCAEDVLFEALICKHCLRDLEPIHDKRSKRFF